MQNGAYDTGQEFTDGSACPTMVVVQAGTFTMGSPVGEAGRDEDEGPQHDVIIAQPFAVGKYQITFDEWEAAVAAGGCETVPDDEGWGQGTRPVINVDWHQVQTYVAWLSQETGNAYRLLSEAEWEYAARAGSAAAYCFGNTISEAQANFNSDGTVPVGSYAGNDFGLYDMHGNVFEWVEDCWNGSYEGAPTDGSAWTTGECDMRLLRGGSWFSADRLLRSAERLRYLDEISRNYLGFRVARALG